MARKKGMTLVDVIVVLFVVFVMLVVLTSCISRSHPSSHRSQCKNNLKQFGLALHNYLETYRTFPPMRGGTGHGVGSNREQLSGVAMMLPFLDLAPLYESIILVPNQGGIPSAFSGDLMPDGEIEIFLCPNAMIPDQRSNGGEPNSHRSYAFCAGDLHQDLTPSGKDPLPLPEGTAWPNNTNIVGAAVNRGMFGFRHCLTERDCLDGTSVTVAMAERDLGNPNDLSDVIGQVTTGGTQSPAACLALQKDGYYLKPAAHGTTRMGDFWADGRPFYSSVVLAVPPNGSSCAPNDDSSGWFTVGGRHQGGAHVLLLDGSVRFVSEKIDTGDLSATTSATPWKSSYGIWGALGTRAGGETIENF